MPQTARQHWCAAFHFFIVLFSICRSAVSSRFDHSLRKANMKKILSFAIAILSAALISGLASGHAAAQTAAAKESVEPVYAVLSLIGDKLSIVVAQSQTGTRVDANRRETLSISEDVFDTMAVSATAAAVRKLRPSAELAALNTRSAVLFEKQRTLFEESGNTIAIPEPIRAALKNQNATHLFLITKRIDEAAAEFSSGTTDGKGKLEGLGFYLDGSIATVDGASGNAGQGFIAPFAYMNVMLIDLATSKIIKKQKITSSWPVSAGVAATDIGSPWAALSSAEKVRLVNELIRREIMRVVPDLMQ